MNEMQHEMSVLDFLEQNSLTCRGLTPVQLERLRNQPVRGVTADSRKVEPGHVFLALRGTSTDGHDFLTLAREMGAALALVDHLVEGVDLPQLVVDEPRDLWAPLLSSFFGHPEHGLSFVGITGTNGKTTTTTLLFSVFERLGFTPGLIGTIAYRYRDRVEPSNFTSPDPEILYPLLARMKSAGVDTVLMEVSSHALAQKRVQGIRFSAAVLTNLTQDHLDFHGTMKEYAAAKSLLFSEHLTPGAKIVAWTGNPHLREIIHPKFPVLGYDADPGPGTDVYVTNLVHSIDGLRFLAHTPGGSVAVSSPLIGSHNVQNLLAALAVVYALDLPLPAAAEALAGVTVPGRLARVFLPETRAPQTGEGGGPRRVSAGDVPVFVDYAHTPDALDRAQSALRPLTRGRLITIFGCGGDRDRTKRPLMGRSVEQFSDLAVVTSDNPRTEAPGAIIDMILSGMGPERIPAGDLATAARGILVEPDRAAAIAAAIAAAGPGDTVLIAGKGHEDYQIIGTIKHHFDDHEHAVAALKRRSPPVPSSKE
ncbi:MAG: UDP-N-acetylmuramoyl-L-alanyl-D-glutamate--2,6-diaminopimelate ligase [Deltaproteobacteria bacterium HGW-Deltaproteobacteria-17]|nr:MAG: UDP-N-acetylmuramoyl-L-alanyl-D-glutamate--2,6-diaminopimelate ligase [Deltaproteobacteria bacterium HGW-Deltaproteobacteria-17]